MRVGALGGEVCLIEVKLFFSIVGLVYIVFVVDFFVKIRRVYFLLVFDDLFWIL